MEEVLGCGKIIMSQWYRGKVYKTIEKKTFLHRFSKDSIHSHISGDLI